MKVYIIIHWYEAGWDNLKSEIVDVYSDEATAKKIVSELNNKKFIIWYGPPYEIVVKELKDGPVLSNSPSR